MRDTVAKILFNALPRQRVAFALQQLLDVGQKVTLAFENDQGSFGLETVEVLFHREVLDQEVLEAGPGLCHVLEAGHEPVLVCEVAAGVVEMLFLEPRHCRFLFVYPMLVL